MVVLGPWWWWYFGPWRCLGRGGGILGHGGVWAVVVVFGPRWWSFGPWWYLGRGDGILDVMLVFWAMVVFGPWVWYLCCGVGILGLGGIGSMVVVY